ncbi:Polygalacturonase inhibitor [Hibiscus syriacus]|uniref:Polygalacturonase inhibitor n=1 Tax=Hibiscus syriacus TaxID=106335 RepID=A0A6A3C971_HIBSY|nr:polygalacturonase inhibitor 1-like [Hibiscus syriacus]KAE8725800.1 Polygalacturonase inhibitor [Hibiscus syriacus]
MKILPVLLCLLFFSTFISPALSGRCNPQDKKVLLKIKKALGNPYLLASWDPKTACCDWYCLECHPDTHRVISLTMFTDNKLTGQIPAEVGDLPYLETLLFRHLPNLNGTIPSTVTKLKNLKTLWVSWTNLSGPIPEFIPQLKNLTYLNLSFNNLTGSIPSSVSTLPNLDSLHLDRNKLTGSIPESFGSFPSRSLYLFILSHNKLSGTIPASLANMDFNIIDLSRNMLQGDPSVLFGKNKTTFDIDLSRNMFQFDLSKLQFPKSLARLDLNHNKITGSIPERLTELDLQFLNVSYNRLCGKIPVRGRL